MTKKKVLVLFAHPSQHRSEVNKPLFEAAKSLDFVTAVDLYAEYPRFNINVNKEQKRLLEHDVIVFQFPFYWYSTPSILKEWQDLVLEYGFAYGHDGKYLRGKQFICAISAGGQEHAYKAEGYNHFTVRELLRPLEQTASLTEMEYLPPLAIFGSRSAKEENRIKQHVSTWKVLLKALSNDTISADNFSDEITINDTLIELMRSEQQ